MFDMTDEWHRYRCRYDGYTPQTLEGFVDNGTATYDPDDDSDTITATRGEGTVET